MDKRLWQTGLLLITLILVGCQGEVVGPAAVAQATVPLEVVVDDTPTKPPVPTDPPDATLSPTTTSGSVVADIPSTESPPTETAVAEPAVQTNGRNPNGTYFRGRSDAPIVMIDYSDFF